MYLSGKERQINLQQLKEEIYFLRLIGPNGQKQTKKVVER